MLEAVGNRPKGCCGFRVWGCMLEVEGSGLSRRVQSFRFKVEGFFCRRPALSNRKPLVRSDPFASNVSLGSLMRAGTYDYVYGVARADFTQSSSATRTGYYTL